MDGHAATRRRITLIDDHAEFRAVMHELLSRDYDVTTFSGSEISPDDIVDSAPDLLIVDMRLDRRDLQGWDIVELARSHRDLRSIPVVVCSADVAELNGREGTFREAGNVAVLRKPFSMETAEQIVSHGLSTGFHHEGAAAAS